MDPVHLKFITSAICSLFPQSYHEVVAAAGMDVYVKTGDSIGVASERAAHRVGRWASPLGVQVTPSGVRGWLHKYLKPDRNAHDNFMGFVVTMLEQNDPRKAADLLLDMAPLGWRKTRREQSNPGEGFSP